MAWLQTRDARRWALAQDFDLTLAVRPRAVRPRTRGADAPAKAHARTQADTHGRSRTPFQSHTALAPGDTAWRSQLPERTRPRVAPGTRAAAPRATAR